MSSLRLCSKPLWVAIDAYRAVPVSYFPYLYGICFPKLKKMYPPLCTFCLIPNQPRKSGVLFNFFRLTYCLASYHDVKTPSDGDTRFVSTSTVQSSESFLLKISSPYLGINLPNSFPVDPSPLHYSHPPLKPHRLLGFLQDWFGFDEDACRV